MRIVKALWVIGAVMGIAAIFLLEANTNWQTALAVFLMIWANNLGMAKE